MEHFSGTSGISITYNTVVTDYILCSASTALYLAGREYTSSIDLGVADFSRSYPYSTSYRCLANLVQCWYFRSCHQDYLSSCHSTVRLGYFGVMLYQQVVRYCDQEGKRIKRPRNPSDRVHSEDRPSPEMDLVFSTFHWSPFLFAGVDLELTFWIS